MSDNQRAPMLHNEGLTTRNCTSYSFQVLRDDIYTVGIDGTVTGNRVAPVRSACAVLVSSQNNDRDWLSYQQQDRKSTRLNSSHANISYAVFCLKKKNLDGVEKP